MGELSILRRRVNDNTHDFKQVQSMRKFLVRSQSGIAPMVGVMDPERLLPPRAQWGSFSCSGLRIIDVCKGVNALLT